MRLQLVAAFAVVAWSGGARAQGLDEPGDGTATSRLLVYADDDETTVITTTVDAQVALPASVTAGAHVLVDVVSSASVDVISAATERWDETRTEAGARATAVVSKVELSGAYVRSQENDWASNAVRIGAARELLSRNLRLELGYGVTFNRVGRAEDPAFERSLAVHAVEAGASQLLDRRTRVGAIYTLQVLDGFQASPYRYVVAEDGARVPETHPERRVRHALTGFAVRSLTGWLAVRPAYRIYADDWGIRSHMGSVRAVAHDDDLPVSGSLLVRAYYQSAAAFYRDSYATALAHMTADRELSTFWDVGATAVVAVEVGPVVLDAKAGVIHYEFDDFSELPTRRAWLVGGGARTTW